MKAQSSSHSTLDAVTRCERDHTAAIASLASAEATLASATTAYNTSLGQGRDAALAARSAQGDAEIDRDIARHAVDRLAAQLHAAREAATSAEVNGKRAEAERRRHAFEEVARQRLARMRDDARAVLRALAEAGIALEEARAAQGLGGPEIPDAEEFRNVRRGADKEVGKATITRWLRPGTSEPYSDEVSRQIVERGGKGFLPNPLVEGGGHQITDRGVFERVTYERASSSTIMPSLAESLCVPALVGGDVPGWTPIDGRADPYEILARLAELEHPSVERQPDLRTVDNFVHRVGAGTVVASA